jgi:hypothetical protein
LKLFFAVAKIQELLPGPLKAKATKQCSYLLIDAKSNVRILQNPGAEVEFQFSAWQIFVFS